MTDYTNAKVWFIDIDGTICEDISNEHSYLMPSAKPIDGALERINKLHERGDYICFFTSRREEHREMTEEWLSEHGFKYNQIIFNKPRGGSYHHIDNKPVRATRFEGEWSEMIVKTREILVFKSNEEDLKLKI